MCVATGVGFAGVGWAAASVMTPAKDVLASTGFTTVEVVHGQVGSSVTLNTVAEWSTVPVGTNQASGIVTTVNITPGSAVEQGTTLYTVNLRPVVIARGDIPAFQPIGVESVGADVAQLQTMLVETGFYRGEADGKAGPRTVAAIRSWQKHLGLAPTGTVALGDVIFVPTLGRISLDATVITRGASINGGEPVVLGLPPAPAFTMPVTANQAAMMPTGTPVQITSPGGAIWDATVTDQVADDSSDTINVVLAGKDGAAICAEHCDTVPVVGRALLTSKVITAATVDGLVVPSAALRSGADGDLSVVDEKGAEHPVTQITGARGMSVIEGVESGLKVRVPALAEAK